MYDFSEMIDKWPSVVVARKDIGKFTGGLISPGTMANLDCQGKGPKGRFRIGANSVAYPVKELVEWLNDRVEPVSDVNNGREELCDERHG